MSEGTYYYLRLSRAARARGDRVVCQLLSWAGADNGLAHVRIMHSTIPSYRTGKAGLIQREYLIPATPRRAA